MPLKILQITRSAEFQNISKKGQKFHSKTILLLTHPTPQNYFQNLAENKNAQDFCRVGYTVSKTVGNAVTRNRAKRRLRALFAKIAELYAKNHYDYVLIARREIAEEDFEKISSDLKFCLKRIHGPSTPQNKK
ncbi:MAG: ribonuclease P protein component [Rickettsiales bacterium]|nr:ribonuclease P protein component [Rickettsiales bacterium]